MRYDKICDCEAYRLQVWLEAQHYPLMIHTGSNRYNKWGLPDFQEKHYFACEKIAVQEDQSPEGK